MMSYIMIWVTGGGSNPTKKIQNHKMVKRKEKDQE